MTTSPEITPAASSSADPASEPIRHLRPPVDPATLTWRALRRDAFWQQIPAWQDVDEETFLDHRWQEKHAITSAKKLIGAVRDLVTAVIRVTEAEIVAAMRLIWTRLKQVVEPSAAVPLAACLGDEFKAIDAPRVGLVLSGGNVDLDRLPW